MGLGSVGTSQLSSPLLLPAVFPPIPTDRLQAVKETKEGYEEHLEEPPPAVDDAVVAYTHFDESKAHGRWPHATFHVITTFIGAGVLALPWTIALVGWPGMILLGWSIVWSIHSACILTRLHEANGTRSGSYREICSKIFGPFWGFWGVVPFQVRYMLVLLVSWSGAHGNTSEQQKRIDMTSDYTTTFITETCPLTILRPLSLRQKL